jgi:hypothetical protein
VWFDVALDVVATYNLFGVSLNAIFSFFRTAVASVMLIYTIRIPFKRKVHWMFLVFVVVGLGNFSISSYANLSPDTATFIARATWIFLFPWSLIGLAHLQFAGYFVAPKLTKWVKYVLAGGLVYVAATNWAPIFVDPSFILRYPTLSSPYGLIAAPGTGDQYVRPYGVDIPVTLITFAALYLLFRHYRRTKSDLLRAQTKYIIIGTAVILFGTYALDLARMTSGVNFSSPIAAVGFATLLLGLRKHGFYSVTPIAETTKAGDPIRVSLEVGRSYLAHDTRVAFEGFSSLVRSGYSGLCLTRTFPEDIRRDYGLKTTPIMWLADEKRGDAIPPWDLLGLSLMVKDFLEKATRPVVMFHGIEYLTTLNGFTPILRLIQGISEANATKRGILFVPIVPDSLNKQEEALLVAETTPLPLPAKP